MLWVVQTHTALMVHIVRKPHNGGEWMLLNDDKTWQEYFSMGVGSRQSGGKHVLFLDLDGYSKEQAERVAHGLISDYALSNCYIVRSSKGNHHLICLDLMEFEAVTKIGKDFAHGTWLKHRKKGRDYVLRITPKVLVDGKRILGDEDKPELVSVIKSPFSYRQKSNALRMVFQDVWKIEIQKDRQFDNSKEYRFHAYRMRFCTNGVIKKGGK